MRSSADIEMARPSLVHSAELPNVAPGAGLGRRFSRSVRDNVLAECLIQIVRLCAMVILARALGAAEFGLFRVLLVAAMLSTMALQPGLIEALVQRKHLTPVHESTAWMVSVVLGLGGAGILYAAAPVIARLMVMPRLTAGVHLICLAIFLDCLAVPSNAYLQRDLRFGTLASAEVAAEVAFLVTALGLLWTRLATWSLMAGLTARLSTRALVLLVAAPRPGVAHIRCAARPAPLRRRGVGWQSP